MNTIFNFFRNKEDSFIKKWMHKVHLSFPNATISLKKDKDIWIIVCDEQTEKDLEFREFALDFLLSFTNKYKDKDIIIVSDKDKFYHFGEYDYTIGCIKSSIALDDIVLYNEFIKIDLGYSESFKHTLSKKTISQKNIYSSSVPEKEWETADCLMHCPI